MHRDIKVCYISPFLVFSYFNPNVIQMKSHPITDILTMKSSHNKQQMSKHFREKRRRRKEWKETDTQKQQWHSFKAAVTVNASVGPEVVQKSDFALMLQHYRGVNWSHRKSIVREGLSLRKHVTTDVSYCMQFLRFSWSWTCMVHAQRLKPQPYVLSLKVRAGPIIFTQLCTVSTSCFLCSHRRMPPERLSVTANRNTVSGTVKKLWYWWDLTGS